MAESPSNKSRKLKSQTVRERADNASSKPAKARRISRTARGIAKPLRSVRQIGKKEYYLPLPQNKTGRFLNKRRHVIPSSFQAFRK